MKTTYNIKNEYRERLKEEYFAKGVGLAIAVLAVIIIYAKLANYILPQ